MKSPGNVHASLLRFLPGCQFECFTYPQFTGAEADIAEQAGADHPVSGKPEAVAVLAVAAMSVFHDGETPVGQAHLMNESGFESMFHAKCPHCLCIRFIRGISHHAIDLYRGQSGFLSCFNAFKYFFDVASACDDPEFTGIGSVETDVDPVKPGLGQICCKFPQQDSIGCKAKINDPIDGCDLLDK
jgi:hypothetical protein